MLQVAYFAPLFPGNNKKRMKVFVIVHEVKLDAPRHTRSFETIYVKCCFSSHRVFSHGGGVRAQFKIQSWSYNYLRGPGLFLDILTILSLPRSVVLNLFYISYPLLSNKIIRFIPNTLNGSLFLKI